MLLQTLQIKHKMIDEILCRVTPRMAWSLAEQILLCQPHGFILSNVFYEHLLHLFALRKQPESPVYFDMAFFALTHCTTGELIVCDRIIDIILSTN